jgi:hypothetical protein
MRIRSFSWAPALDGSSADAAHASSNADTTFLGMIRQQCLRMFLSPFWTIIASDHSEQSAECGLAGLRNCTTWLDDVR